MISTLIVDDEEDLCDFLAGILRERMGLDVKFALSGEEALRLIHEREWHIALIDLKLVTAVTGLDVIKAIRDQWPRAIVLAMTGYVDVGLRQKAEKLGVADYLEKPDDIEPNVLIDKIQALISKDKKLQ